MTQSVPRTGHPKGTTEENKVLDGDLPGRSPKSRRDGGARMSRPDDGESGIVDGDPKSVRRSPVKTGRIL